MNIKFNNSVVGQYVNVLELDKTYQGINYKVTVCNKGGCIISDIDNEEISLHVDLCVLIGAFYESFLGEIVDVFAFYENNIYHKEMTETRNIILKFGFVNFNYNAKEYLLDLNKLVISSEVFCAASQAELNEVQENV